MTDISTITTALSGIKAAIDIAKALKDSDHFLEKAELKYKLAEMMNSLADAKLAMIDAQELIQAKDKEIIKLKDSLKLKGKLERYRYVYYFLDDNGIKMGDPFCSYCYESKNELIHVVQDPLKNRDFVCPGCKTVTDWHRLDNGV
ncbi:MAG: hypothetical protein IPJ69_12180 [Deltaproteobacteria bacterium]|nr:MAG: hypothetical protein IPJ69_12180 [Deltaproteobacteria bacterium]